MLFESQNGEETERAEEFKFNLNWRNHFPKSITYTKPQTQEAQRPPSGINTKTNKASEHIIIKLLQI